MINGELIVDNFAGAVRGYQDTELSDQGRSHRTVKICINSGAGNTAPEGEEDVN